MGFVDKLKSIITWESMVTLSVFFAVLGAIAIVAMYLGFTEIAIGVVVAFGIPTSIFGGMSTKATGAVVPNPKPTDESSLKKELVDIKVCLADTRSELLSTKSELALLKSKVGD